MSETMTKEERALWLRQCEAEDSCRFVAREMLRALSTIDAFERVIEKLATERDAARASLAQVTTEAQEFATALTSAHNAALAAEAKCEKLAALVERLRRTAPATDDYSGDGRSLKLSEWLVESGLAPSSEARARPATEVKAMLFEGEPCCDKPNVFEAATKARVCGSCGAFEVDAPKAEQWPPGTKPEEFCAVAPAPAVCAPPASSKPEAGEPAGPQREAVARWIEAQAAEFQDVARESAQVLRDVAGAARQSPLLRRALSAPPVDAQGVERVVEAVLSWLGEQANDADWGGRARAVIAMLATGGQCDDDRADLRARIRAAMGVT